MKLLFVSDIHGSLFYAHKAIESFHNENAQHIIFLGDILYHGPRNPLPKDYYPKEVANLLNNYADKIIAVRGNCDSEVDQMMLNFPIMADYSNILYKGRRLFLTHGHIYNADNIPNLSKGDLLIYGHTHVPRAEKRGHIYIINPGSVSIPKESSPNSYGVLKDNVFRIKGLDGKVIKEIVLDKGL
ncbi:MAG: phosphodiesterase [Clostridiales bacterium]|uniref:phosphodiesterase n=1 Tax=Clostridium sp. N3C TaxID=1776758 RepID=UPI00092DF8A7|nr:phosphodiesterase [Clostridium sp. N3C]NLZ48876.1 phosphodiesterase [Clostridiales bacterium]SCN24585.1 Phosphodiesterase YfcE [Clostridium sp. N3C]